ncbi:MAG: serine/threonine-protein kinase [Myxococcales bacterium]|nr:serine/threonine protein kinase [Polyangiaceae bacterium]MDW8250294.1 serine/threonine-protein kinase [Myxococcales bacterium]
MKEDTTPTAPGDEVATTVEDPPSTTRQLGTPTGAGSVMMARALHAEESARCRSFGRIIALLAGGSACVIPWLGGTPWLAGATQATLLWLLGVALWVWRIGAAEERYSPLVFQIFGWSCVLTSIFINYYFGVFSPAPTAVTLGISFFALSDNRRLALSLSTTATGFYLLLAVGILTEILPDAGVFSVRAVPERERIFLLVIVPVIFLVTLLQARESRAATHDALRQAQSAMLLAHQQEARLQEAHQDLDAALRISVGREGRYSGQLVGSYKLGEIIGLGAMGEVYEATGQDGRPVAVKMLSMTASHNINLHRRFLREGAMAARLDAPNIVKVLDVGEAGDGAPFLAMERLEGTDLSAWLREHGRLSLPEVIDLARQVSAGLAVAHQAGVIHRDLKPQNLFRCEREGKVTWKILDFGVSKLGRGDGTLTRRTIIGTPGYMSPEQAQGLEAEVRSDIFALGAVVYRALTARPPFTGPDTPQILFAVCFRMPQRPSSLVENLPPDVDLALAIALAKSTEDRYESAPAFAEALMAASQGLLPDHLRTRATVILNATPWGHRLGC